MKRSSVVAVMLLMLALASGCRRRADAKLGDDRQQRDSYSLGYQLGTSFEKQGTSINVDAYVAGLREALAGKPAQVSDDEMRSALSQLRVQAAASQRAAQLEKADGTRSEGQAFLERNRLRAGVKQLPSGLQYRVVREGSGASPGANDTVTVHYRSSLVKGREIANSYKQGKPVTVGLGGVIPGWREALQLMREGAKWELFVPPQLAYGARGSPGIAPNSTLVFEVELLHVDSSQIQARAAPGSRSADQLPAPRN